MYLARAASETLATGGMALLRAVGRHDGLSTTHRRAPASGKLPNHRVVFQSWSGACVFQRWSGHGRPAKGSANRSRVSKLQADAHARGRPMRRHNLHKPMATCAWYACRADKSMTTRSAPRLGLTPSGVSCAMRSLLCGRIWGHGRRCGMRRIEHASWKQRAQVPNRWRQTKRHAPSK